jgi:DNA-binding helix-hairpin-helix protein with protein kinase domain
MGIDNIHILINPEPIQQQTQALAALQQALIEEHRQGEHPWGRMIRECPLCQAS